MIDLLVADAAAWVMTNGLWLAAIGIVASTAYLAGRWAAPAWMRRRIRTLGRANKALRADNAGLLLIAAIERDNAVAAVQYAAKAERRLEAVVDGVKCAEMELRWEEER